MENEAVIEGVTVEVLLEHMERLAAPCRGNSRSFQYAGALDSAAKVIRALLAERAKQ